MGTNVAVEGMQLRQYVLWLCAALAAAAPAMVLRWTGARPDPLLDTLIFGTAILAAGFMLSWGSEAAEGQISAGLILAGVALITVLPEYAVDFYYAYRAGVEPQSNYVHYAAANMTGANRLLVGVAWPLLVILHWWRSRGRGVGLAQVNAIEISFLLLPSLYAFIILWKNRISLLDTAVLLAMFGTYLWRVSRLPKTGADKEEAPGLGSAIEKLPVPAQWVLMAGLIGVAAVVIFFSAEPFAESMVASGRRLGIDEFLLIQWLAPLASEAPSVTVAVVFVLSGRAAAGLTTMISDKINQWTLLVGMLPLAMSAGAGALTALPLDARQHEEFFLTAAQSLFGIALLLRLRLGLGGAFALVALFSMQVVLAFTYRDDAQRTIQVLTWLGWVYIALAAGLAVRDRRQLLGLLRAAFPARSDGPIPR